MIIATFANNRRAPSVPERKHRINGEITAKEVRVNNQNNETLGIMSLREALDLAAEQDTDLVEIAPMAKPPVCRLIDYGKFRYAEQKKAAEAKAKQKVVDVKEIVFRPGTGEADYQVKLRNLHRFIDNGDKAKVTLRFRGRELSHKELGMELLNRVRSDMDEVAAVEAMPKLEGRQMIMVLAPKKKK